MVNIGKIYLADKNEDSQRGVMLISVYFLIIVLLAGMTALYGFALADWRAAARSDWSLQAFHAAEAGIDAKMDALNSADIDPSLTGTITFSKVGMTAIYEAEYSTAEDGTEQIVSTGTVYLDGDAKASRTVQVTLDKASFGVPPGAISITGESSSLGGVNIDGRDHDQDGNLTGDPGVPGIATPAGSFNQGGSSTVGGNGAAPALPANPAAIETGVDPLGSTPEEILGLAPGALDAYKSATPPTAPFSGINYVTGDWTSADIDGSSGILIVHNDASTALLKNIHGTFKGLIIADDVVHINAGTLILGAVFGLKSDGVTIGNGNSDIKYSSEVLANLPLATYHVTSWQDQT